MCHTSRICFSLGGKKPQNKLLLHIKITPDISMATVNRLSGNYDDPTASHLLKVVRGAEA
jgi:hypothetical protein